MSGSHSELLFTDLVVALRFCGDVAGEKIA